MCVAMTYVNSEAISIEAVSHTALKRVVCQSHWGTPGSIFTRIDYTDTAFSSQLVAARDGRKIIISLFRRDIPPLFAISIYLSYITLNFSSWIVEKDTISSAEQKPHWALATDGWDDAWWSVTGFNLSNILGTYFGRKEWRHDKMIWM